MSGVYRCNSCRGEVAMDADAEPAGDCGDPDCSRRGRWTHVGRDCHRLLWAIGPFPVVQPVATEEDFNDLQTYMEGGREESEAAARRLDARSVRLHQKAPATSCNEKGEQREMNLFEKITQPYATTSGPVLCHHPDMVRTVRADAGYPVWIARCPACPALAGSVVGPPYIAPWYLGRPK